MKISKIITCLLSTLTVISFMATIPGLCAVDMDYTADGVVDTFDLISARKSGNENEILRLNDFILGKTTSKDEYILEWSDEFDGNSINSDNWSYELGNWKTDSKGNYITNGWGNNEQQFYTESNTSVKDGILTIAARKEKHSDPKQGNYEYTSARLSSQYKYSTCGGKIEVRARCDSGKSLWPAIWMLPEDSVYGGWAASGEIDIMEGWGSKPDKICGTIHFGDVWPNNTYLTGEYSFDNNDSTENWHTYSIEWDKDEIRWYLDNTLYSTQKDWYSINRAYPAPFDQNFYIILNLAIGGHFDGIDGIYADPSIFENGEKHFDIDYVRVYRKNGDQFTPTIQTSESLSLYREGAEAGLTNKDGLSDINIKSIGEKPYSVMGLIEEKQVRSNEEFTLTFSAKSSINRSITVTVEDPEYNRYLDETINIGTEDSEYSFNISFSYDMLVDIKFLVGKINDDTQDIEHTITLSNISWK